MKNYLFLLLFLFCINAYSQKNSGIFYSTLFTKEGVYLRNDDFGNNADYVFFCDVMEMLLMMVWHITLHKKVVI